MEIRRLQSMDRYETTDGRECVHLGSRAYAIVNGSGQVLTAGSQGCCHVYELRNAAEYFMRQLRMGSTDGTLLGSTDATL